MPLKFTTDPKVITRKIKNVLMDIPRIAGIEAERFFKESFRRQGWHDNVFTPWKARKGGRTRTLGEKKSGRSVLIKTGALRRSIRVIHRGRDFVVLGTSLPYAKIHNEGGIISGRFRVRTHTRRNRQGEGTHTVTEHSRTVNRRMPRRRFMGNSNALNYKINTVIRYRIKQI